MQRYYNEIMIIKCPQCKKETFWENNPYKPFCSERCRLIDLGMWIEEKYRLPVVESETDNKDNE